MTYTSYGFAFLTAAALILFYACGGRFQKQVLLITSAVFIVLAGGIYSLFFILLSAGISFLGALFMEKAEQPKGIEPAKGTGHAGDPELLWKKRKTVFVLAVCMQLLMLAVFKYLNFPNYTKLAFAELTGREFAFEEIALTAPLGISFYALMQISYLTDVYWNSRTAEHSFLRYGIFSALFLHIVQGPVDRYGTVSNRLSERIPLDLTRISAGLFRLSWGLFKKLVISERLAVFVNTIYGDTLSYSGSYLVFAAICYALQLYTDFSGCMDLVLGIGEMFGLRLSENFKQPFFSRSDAEFWRRWHVSLGNWFRDYLMYPMLRTKTFRNLGNFGKRVFGKKQGKKLPVCLSLLIVWSLLGLWHGGMWTFIIGSGLLHCMYMILAQIFEPAFDGFYRVTGLNRDNPVWKAFQMLRTFVLVSIGFVFFRSDSLTMAFDIFRGMGSGDMGLFGGEGFLSLGMSVPDAIVLVLGLLLLFVISWKLEKTEMVTTVGGTDDAKMPCFAERLLSGRGTKAYLTAALLLLFCVLIFGFYGQGYDASAFIYSQF